MLEFAELLTVSPASMKEEYVQELRDVGWTDEDIIDIVHIIAFFNYMVRVADGLGVELEASRGWEPLAENLSFQGKTTPKSFGNIAAGRLDQMPSPLI